MDFQAGRAPGRERTVTDEGFMLSLAVTLAYVENIKKIAEVIRKTKLNNT